jgi:hypothetical protein
MDTSTPEAKKKRGPIPKGYEDTHVLLPPHLIAWAKQQEGGLAGVMRRLLSEEYERRAAERTRRSPVAPGG